MTIKNICYLLILCAFSISNASADFLGIGHWTKRHITQPIYHKVIQPVVKETKHQVGVIRNGKLYKEGDKLLVSTSRAVKKDCNKALTTAFTPLVGMACTKTLTAALTAACIPTLGSFPGLMPVMFPAVGLCAPLPVYTAQIGCDGPVNDHLFKISNKVAPKFKHMMVKELAKLTCDVI